MKLRAKDTSSEEEEEEEEDEPVRRPGAFRMVTSNTASIKIFIFNIFIIQHIIKVLYVI